jgi:hypothetical protein
MKIKINRKSKIKGNIAPLSAIQIQKLKEYEKEMEVILIAYQKEKVSR